MLAWALGNRCEQPIHLSFNISQQSQAWIVSMSWHVPLLLFIHPPLLRTKASDPAARAHTQHTQLCLFSNSPTAFSCLSLSHTNAWQPPTPIHLIIKAEGLCAPSTSFFAFGANNTDIAFTLIAPHVQHSPTYFFSKIKKKAGVTNFSYLSGGFRTLFCFINVNPSEEQPDELPVELVCCSQAGASLAGMINVAVLRKTESLGKPHVPNFLQGFSLLGN